MTTTFQLCLKIYWKLIVANEQKTFKILNISCHNCHMACGNCDKRNWEVWKKILWHLWQRLFNFTWKYIETPFSLMAQKIQTLQHLLSQMPQEEQLGLWQMWQEVLTGLKKILWQLWQRLFSFAWKYFTRSCGNCDKRFWEVWKKSCGSCDKRFSALPENISHGLVAIVTRDFARFEKKNIVALVTKIWGLNCP